MADIFVEPFGLGWHLKRADFQMADGMMFPTGRYTSGATNNVGTGYFGNHLLYGKPSTSPRTKEPARMCSPTGRFTESGRAPTPPKTPGQAFTLEWGLGQFYR